MSQVARADILESAPAVTLQPQWPLCLIASPFPTSAAIQPGIPCHLWFDEKSVRPGDVWGKPAELVGRCFA